MREAESEGVREYLDGKIHASLPLAFNSLSLALKPSVVLPMLRIQRLLSSAQRPLLNVGWITVGLPMR